MVTLLLITTLFITQPINSLQIINANVNDHKDGDIFCSGNEDCQINCNSVQSCRNTEIYCPIGYNCHIFCDSNRACQDTNITAIQSTSLTVNGCNHGTLPCDGMIIYWPMTEPFDNAKRGNLNVNHLFTNPTFFAQNGWYDINTTLYNGTIYGGTNGESSMSCGHNYNDTCIIADDEWRCKGIHHICNSLLSKICKSAIPALINTVYLP